MRLAGVALALALTASPLAAQAGTVVAAGRVVRITASDTVPAGAAGVVLHRIGRDRQGPLDSVTADAAGRFRFRFPADTAALYILTSRHHGVQYFSEPVHTNPARPDTALVLAVHDTSSRQPVSLAARNIVVSAPEADGTRSVVELLALRNEGPLTRVPAESAEAAWMWRIPRGVAGFAADAGELSAGAIDLHGDSVLVLAALPPGLREITVEYLLPGRQAAARFPFDEGAEAVNLLVEERAAAVTLPAGLRPDSATVIEERKFRRWTGAVAAGEMIVATLPVPGRAGRGALTALIVLLALALTAGALRVLRGGRRRPTGDATTDPDALLDAIARLDASHAASGPHDAEAERRHAEARSALKAQLERALARRAEHP